MTRTEQTVRSYAAAAFALILLLAAQCLAARAEDAAAEIRQALAQWTDDFNAGRADKVCDLFAKDARADVADAPERELHCDLRRADASAE